MPTDAIKDSGQRTEFDTGAVRDMHEGKGRYDLLPWEAIHEVAKHCEAGGAKYGERNCEKGIPIHSLIDSAIRHLICYLRGMDDEPHLRAAAWNVLFAIWTEIKHPELQDIPCRQKPDPSVELLLKAVGKSGKSPTKAVCKFKDDGDLLRAYTIDGFVLECPSTQDGVYFITYCDGYENIDYLGENAINAFSMQREHGPIIKISDHNEKEE